MNESEFKELMKESLKQPSAQLQANILHSLAAATSTHKKYALYLLPGLFVVLLVLLLLFTSAGFSFANALIQVPGEYVTLLPAALMLFAGYHYLNLRHLQKIAAESNSHSDKVATGNFVS